MCRLYGFCATEPTKVECTLVHAQNALLTQSRSDLRGQAHPDGWGIGYYANTQPTVERRDTAAYHDLHFSVIAERIFVRTAIAHVRQATMGAPTLVNTHPFVYDRWMFAHNGTVRAFEQVGTRLERETDVDLLRLRRGGTDSELTFYWILSRMRYAGIVLDDSITDVVPVVDVVRRAIRDLQVWCFEAGAQRPAKLNFLLTEGTRLVASRWGNTLYLARREGIHDCEICGIPHIHHSGGSAYRAAIVASEPISHEFWQVVPNSTVIAVDNSATVMSWPV